jgi:hypothetical protein
MSNTSETTRCPCGSDEELRISKEGKEAWILCKDCNVWQHLICVGLLDDVDHMPEDYFCEECKPQHHVRFFEFGKGLDGPKTPRGIAKQRQRMHVMKRTDPTPEFREKTMWLINELMAIVEGHSASLAAPWIFVSGLSEDVWKADGFGRMLVLSIRIVLRNADMAPLEDFRAKLVKVRFSEGDVVAKELWTLRMLLAPEFMERMERVENEEWLEEKYDMKGLNGMGKANAELMRKYFNL